MLDKEMNYILEQYQQKSLFSSFLPGISGELGDSSVVLLCQPRTGHLLLWRAG